MKDTMKGLLAAIEANHLPGVDAGSAAIYPFYQGASLVNLPSSICYWLGAPPFGAAPLLPEILDQAVIPFRHVILLVVDGLGLNFLQQAIDGRDPDLDVWRDLASRGALAPLTSIVPSTTSAALTTFWTGRGPAQHGVMAYEVWLKEYGVIANMILQSPASFVGEIGSLHRAGFNPQAFLPVSTLGPHLLRAGVRVYAFQHQAIAHSGLSNMLLQGVEVNGFRSLGDLWVSLKALLEARPDERNYTYIYWGDLDEHMHRFGPGDERVALEFANFSRQLEYFLRVVRKREDTLLLITADHGHLSTPRSPGYELRNHPELLSLMVMSPSGEARMPFVYLRPGCEGRFLDYLEDAWPGQFLAVQSRQAVEAGLFGLGEVYPRTLDRVGDYVVVPQGGAYWWFADRDNTLLGRHGGMSRTEMLVPLLSVIL